jgi:hypothetical protein
MRVLLISLFATIATAQSPVSTCTITCGDRSATVVSDDVHGDVIPSLRGCMGGHGPRTIRVSRSSGRLDVHTEPRQTYFIGEGGFDLARATPGAQGVCQALVPLDARSTTVRASAMILRGDSSRTPATSEFFMGSDTPGARITDFSRVCASISVQCRQRRPSRAGGEHHSDSSAESAHGGGATEE